MSVYIQSIILVNQPTVLKESLIQIQTDQMSINGSVSRNRIGQKKQVDMEFAQLSPTDYQSLIANFTTGDVVTYLNDQSDYSGGTFSFTGLPTFTETEYVQGGSLYRSLQVNVREV